jgi:alkylation response protein AidB-like acyl-CoA dehydrogenase
MMRPGPDMKLTAKSLEGGRFVALAEEHGEAFRNRATEHDRTSTFPVANFDDMRRSGALAAFVPEDLGGLGLESVHDWAVAMERFGRADPSTAIALNMHLGVSRNLALAWRRASAGGSAAQIAASEGPLRAIAGGKLLICATATEPGTDFLRPMTTATPVDGGWSISGRKIFVTLSEIADLFTLNLRIEDPSGDKMGFAFVPAGSDGLEPQGDWQALGMRASGSQSVVLRDCRVPTSAVQIAGEWGRWNPGVLMGRTLGNLTLVAVFLGIAERARELAVTAARTQSKPKYAGTLAGTAGAQHLMGEIDIELAAARALLGTTAADLDRLLDGLGGTSPDLETAHRAMRDYQCAKWVVNQGAMRIVSRAMDICGGGAYTDSHELSRLYRDVRAGPFMQPFSPTEAREYVGQVGLGLYPDG